ncbi:DUF4397 domain-containing protein [Pedobacter cryoconitis]|uniref:Uncharacterized protein DUF4397 n=1 Tax=Pedobacter cryoconitis TaxID=188932 RepID=A0A327T1J0_9SPHI|nr:DUF4397 domain-containing protein [Pedobacter cryoconitis]RAJ35510.1 uncharacterized protein DUF4397 [Pedobacter cryoconitis]
MKFNLTSFSKNIKRTLVVTAVAGAVLSFNACKKDTPIQQDRSALSITNASPLNDSVDFILNNRRITSGSLPFGKSYNYFTLTSGTQLGALAKPGSVETFYKANFDLATNQYHSLYITTQTLAKADSSAFLVIKDDFTAPAAGNGKIRFINLSSDSPAYDLVIEGDTTSFKNRAFKEYTVFKNLKPAKYKVSVVNTTTKAVAATLADVEITAGNFYTIYAKGLLGATVPAKQLSITSSLHRF